MKKIFYTLLLFMGMTTITKSQVVLPVNTTVTQNFNAIGSSGTATLPANWKFSAPGNGTAATWTAGTNTTATTQAANSGSPATGAAYNWATAAGTDRAIGFMNTASYASPNAIMGYFRNTTGGTVTSVTVGFSVERYRINSSTCTVSFFSSADGNTWTARTAGDLTIAVFQPGSSSYTFTAPQSIAKTVTITGISVTNNSDIYFKWVFSNTTIAQSQGIGLDDVSVLAGTPAPVMSADLAVVLTDDVNGNGQPNAGDKLTYTATVKNNGNGAATNVNYTNTAPANTAFSGTVKTSALARDDNYTTAFNTVLNGTSVLANDFGLPSLSVVSFGAVGNTVTVANGTNTAATEAGGTVLFNTNGTFTYTPPTGFAGVDRFAYIAATGNMPNDDAVVFVTVGSGASAVNDTYSVVGNVSISPLVAAGIMANDPGENKLLLAVNGSAANIGTAISTAQGGSLTVNANGSFSYDPPAGYEGSDQFTYTIDNAFSTPTTATVTLNISGMIWFVNNTAGTNGNGKLNSPFNSLANFQAVNTGAGNNPASNDNIFLYESGTDYTGPVSLLNGQKLIGQDATATLAAIAAVTVPAYSTALPVVNSANGTIVRIITTVAATNAINLASGASNTLNGFTIGNTTGNGISGTGIGTLTVADVAKNGTGNAFTLSGGTINGNMSTVTTTSSTTPISLTSMNGTFSVNAGNITGATGTAVSITGGSGTFTITAIINNPGGTAFLVSGGNGTITQSGTITKNNAGRLLDIQSRTGGTVSINGDLSSSNTAATGILIQNNTGGTINLGGTSKLVNTSANTPVTIAGNTGATINIPAGGLALTSTTSTAFNVSGGGTITVTGSNNTITAGSGIALSVVNTTIGAAGLIFRSIACNGSATAGILLNNTGSGGLTVTGTGTPGTGGTIQNCVQRGARFVSAANISLSWMTFTNNGTANLDAAATAGDALNGTNTNAAAGIDLQTVNGISLTNVTITGGAQIGLNGKGVSNMVLTNCSVQNAGNEIFEDGVQLVNLSGTCSVTNSVFSGNSHRQFEVQNSAGNLNLTMAGCTFDRLTYVSTAAQGMLLVGHGSATIVASVKSSQFRNNWGTAFTCQGINNGNVNITLGSNGLSDIPAEGNTFTDNSLSWQMLTDNAATLNFSIGNNVTTISAVVTSGATPCTVRKGTSSTGFVGGTIGYNRIGIVNVVNSGTNSPGVNGLSITNEALSGGMNITVRNNTFNSISQRGMEALLQLNDLMNIVVVNNLFQSPNPGTPRVGHAIFMQSGTDATDAGTLCADIQGNVVNGGPWDNSVVSGNMRVRMSPAAGSADKFRLRGLASGAPVDVVNFLNSINTNAQATATTPTAYTTGGAACY